MVVWLLIEKGADVSVTDQFHAKQGRSTGRWVLEARDGSGRQLVVYNHTTDAGQNGKNDLDRIVPGYYHRLDANGKVTTSTCCAANRYG